MQYYIIKGEADSVAKYAKYFALYNDSVIKERQFEQTRNADAEYRYQRNIEQEAQILQRDAMLRKRIFAISIASLLVVMGAIAFYVYRRKRMLELLLSKDRTIEQYSTEIANKQETIEEAIKTNEALDTQLSDLQLQIEKKQEQNNRLMQMAFMAKAEEEAMEIIEKFKKAAVGQHPLTDDEWKELMGAIDDMYPTFKSILQNKMPNLSKPVIQTAYIMRAGMTNTQIANLMNAKRQTVWYRVKAIREAMGKDWKIDLGAAENSNGKRR